MGSGGYLARDPLGVMNSLYRVEAPYSWEEGPVRVAIHSLDEVRPLELRIPLSYGLSANSIAPGLPRGKPERLERIIERKRKTCH